MPMNYFSIDFLIVYGFLAITVIIGVWSGRGIKDIREYAIANRKYSTGVLVIGFLATWVGGSSILGESQQVFEDGIIRVVTALSQIVSILFIAWVIAPKMERFTDSITLGDLMGQFYGKYGRLITGWASLGYTIGLVGMQVVSLGYVYEFLGLQNKWGMFLGGSILVIYSAIGGIKSITITDIIQFVILIIVVPLIANVVTKEAGGIKEVFFQIPKEKLVIFEHKRFSYYLMLFILAIFPVGLLSPPFVQRLLMAKNKEQAARMYIAGAVFLPLSRALILLIGFSAFVAYPHVKSSQIIPTIINQLLPVGLKGLSIAGLLAIIMSTADSFLGAGGLVFTHDVVKPICDKMNWAINELKAVRYITFVIGALSTLFAFILSNIANLGFYAVTILGPIVTIPLVAGIIGLKTNSKTFLIAFLTTMVSFVCSSILLSKSNSYLIFPISLFTNLFSFLLAHFIQYKSFTIVSDRTYTLSHKKLVFGKHTTNSLKNLTQNVFQYFNQRINAYKSEYVLFGLFLSFNYMVPYFMYTRQNETQVLLIRTIGAILCVGLLLKNYWESWLKKNFQLYWYLTVFYCLSFSTTLLYLLNQGGTEWTVNIALSTMLLIILVDWVSFIIMSLAGVGIVALYWKLFIDKPIYLSYEDVYVLCYTYIFSVLIGLIFARRKEQHFDRIVTHNQTLTLVDQENKEALLEIFKEKIRLLKTLKRAGVEDLTKAVNLVKELRIQENQGFKEATTVHNVLNQLQNTLTPMAVALERIESRATDYMRLDIKPIAINSLLEGVQAKFLDTKFHINNTSTCQDLICDPKCIQKMLVSSIEALIASNKEEERIYITLADTQLTYPLPSVKKDKSYVKTVSAVAFTLSTVSNVPSISTVYKAQMHTSALPMPETSIAFLLVSNQRIVKAHYGYTNVDISKQGNYDVHCYVLPIRVSEVRPRDMDDPYMELGAELVRADDTFPGALEQEKAFSAAVKQKSNANLTAIETAIEMIKWYHGAVRRKSGEPFYLHPLTVAHIVLDYHTDEATILGALLHDIVEDTPMVLENLEMMFGKEVVGIVDGVTHFESMQESFYKVQLAPHENIMMLLSVEDKRVLYVKMADRMHNMRTIEGHSSYAKKRQIAEETLQFFVPLAQKLGLEEAATELQERSVAVINNAK
jgi:Na+/proline symporter